jgi:pyruvate dehydrogenase E2 component (dihydrolipoamide acetyltransferase)
MDTTARQTEKMFREFQTLKYNPKRSVPAVSMTVNANVTRLLDLKKAVNGCAGPGPHITVTHLVIQAVSRALIQYPILYSFFDGRKIIDNPEIMMNIPVDVDHHVDYVVIHRPDAKNLSQIARECSDGLGKIHQQESDFLKYLRKINQWPSWMRQAYGAIPGVAPRFLRQHYGNFAISNFGSFNVDHGSIAISQPMIASLCFCKISPVVVMDDQREMKTMMSLPLTVVFDHRAVDGAYAGRFLNAIKPLLETPEELFDTLLSQDSLE